MNDLGIVLGNIMVERMRDRVYGAVTNGPERARPIPEARRRPRLGLRFLRRTPARPAAPRPA